MNPDSEIIGLDIRGSIVEIDLTKVVNATVLDGQFATLQEHSYKETLVK